MFVADHYYLFLVAGVLLVGYAIWRQVRRIKEVCNCGHDHAKKDDILHKHFFGHMQNRHAVRAAVFKGFVLQALAGFVGSLFLLMGVIGLIVHLVK